MEVLRDLSSLTTTSLTLDNQNLNIGVMITIFKEYENRTQIKFLNLFFFITTSNLLFSSSVFWIHMTY